MDLKYYICSKKIMIQIKYIFSFLAVVFLLGCPSVNIQKTPNPKPTIFTKNKLLLISLDGFRWDYLEMVETPNLDRFIKTGVKAKSLIPSFPSKTFPNHYSIVTGSYPANHGLISNHMYDEKLGAYYTIGPGATAVRDGRWYQREPIWVTAEKNDIETGIYYWPGSEAEISGYRPAYYKAYNPNVSWNSRVDQIVSWLKEPAIGFTALYFNEPDKQGHAYGPATSQVFEKIKILDQTLGRLFTKLKEEKLDIKTNIIIVSDHGMASINHKDVIYLDDYIDLDDVEVIDWFPVASIRPKKGKLEKVYHQLKNAHPHLQVYLKDSIPSKFHYSNNVRIQPITGIADLHYTISSHQRGSYSGGAHGYDPAHKEMHAILLASGPDFKSDIVVPSKENIHIYELMCKLLGIEPSENDGNLDAVSDMLK